jgi:hypothetical protein
MPSGWPRPDIGIAGFLKSIKASWAMPGHQGMNLYYLRIVAYDHEN